MTTGGNVSRCECMCRSIWTSDPFGVALRSARYAMLPCFYPSMEMQTLSKSKTEPRQESNQKSYRGRRNAESKWKIEIPYPSQRLPYEKRRPFFPCIHSLRYAPRFKRFFAELNVVSECLANITIRNDFRFPLCLPFP
jgi:hypothetical protein